MSSKDEFDFDLDEIEESDISAYGNYDQEVVQRNNFGEFYALQDFEE